MLLSEDESLSSEDLKAINAILDAGMSQDRVDDALANTKLVHYGIDEVKLLGDFEEALNDVCREEALDYKVPDIMQAVIEPRGDLTEWMLSNKYFFSDERIDGLYSTLDAVKRLAHLTLEYYKRYVRVLGLSAKLMQKLADLIGDVKVRTLDNKLFYLDYPTGASLPFLFVEQSSLNAKGMVDGYEFCDDIFVWSIFGDDDGLLQLVECLAESTRELTKGNELLNFTLH